MMADDKRKKASVSEISILVLIEIFMNDTLLFLKKLKRRERIFYGLQDKSSPHNTMAQNKNVITVKS